MMNKREFLNNLKDQENTATDNGIAGLDDDMLQSVSGGCVPSCGGGGGFGSTPDFSCVAPGRQCP